jgi:hypothetical protein
VPTRNQALQHGGDRVLQVVIDEVQQIRRWQLGLHVDRDPVTDSLPVRDMYLVVRGVVGGSFAPPVDSVSYQDPI